ncbi:unnamed protein product [Caenorhabditis sp. 36 PRJEB53466]|nr:unnamed protein product [Caenorhabditis sp. 36 PRJEB53466]
MRAEGVKVPVIVIWPPPSTDRHQQYQFPIEKHENQASSEKMTVPISQSLSATLEVPKSCITTPSGTMMVTSDQLQSELSKFKNLTTNASFPAHCYACRVKMQRLHEANEKWRQTSVELRRYRKIAYDWERIANEREWRWRAYAQMLQQTLDSCRNAKESERIEPLGAMKALEALCERGTLGNTSDDRKISDTLARRRHEMMEEQQKKWREAVRRFEEAPVYKDPKIVIRTALFDPSRCNGIPQHVRNPTGSFFLYRAWSEKQACRVDYSKEWSAIKSSKTDEYWEWKNRASNISHEHSYQLSKGWIWVTTRKRTSENGGGRVKRSTIM